jgi:hypothetical protein
MPRTQDGLTEVSLKWKDTLRRQGKNVGDLIDNVDEVFTLAYELGGVGRWNWPLLSPTMGNHRARGVQTQHPPAHHPHPKNNLHRAHEEAAQCDDDE